MFRRLCAALATSALIAGLLAPTPTLATDGTTPTCDPASLSVNEDDVLNDSVTCSDTEPDDQYDVVSNASDGLVNLNANSGSFSYTPSANFNGSDQFTYRLIDPDGNSNTATIDITVDPVNDVPSFSAGPDKTVPENDSATSVAWATAISKGPANESGQTVSFIVTNNNTSLFSADPAVSPSGVLSFTPASGESGSATVTVRIKDNGGTSPGVDTSSAQTFTIDVTGVNDPPSFTKGGNQTVLEDASSQTDSGWATGISPGPPDESGQNVTFVVTNNNNGLFSSQPAVNGNNGNLTYTPAANANGNATVTLHAHDNGGGSTDDSPAETFTITVTAVNDRPSFNPGANQAVAENAGAQSDSGWATGADPGPADESGQALTYVVDGNTNSALFSAGPAVSSSGTLTYTPAASKSGSATITLHIHDSGGTANGGNPDGVDETFTITVSGVNDPPSFTKGANQTDLEDAGAQTVSNWATDISPGPSDESGQAVTFVVTNNNNGLFSSQPAVSSGGNLTYTPAVNANGAATVTLHAHDNGGGATDDSAPQTFTITVTAVNDPPTFTKGANQADNENAGPQSVTGWATAISEGPANESSQAVAFTVTNNNTSLFSADPAVSPTGTLTYTPATSANGSATVSVQLFDNGPTGGTNDNSSAVATFTITVTGVNDPPSFVKGANQTDLEDAPAQTVPGWATAISRGPADESGQTVTFLIDSNTNPALFTSGPAVNGTNGNLTYTPALNANGIATITLHAHDNGGGATDDSAPQTFTITITPVNDPPTFVKGPDQTALEDSGAHSVVAWATALSKGPLDEATQTLTFVVVSNNRPDLFAVQPAIGPTGDLTYSLVPDTNGTATIIIQLHDNGTAANGGDDTSNTQTFHINVSPQNDGPTCTNATAATFVGTALNSTLTTCTDIDADGLDFSLVSPAAHGTATVNLNGSFTYTPNAAYQGNDSFTFKGNDGTLDSNVVTMAILISPDPIAKNDVAPTDFPAIVQGSGPTAIPVLANDQDKQGGPLRIASVTQGTKGTVAITGGGTGLTYDPTGFATGADSFRYTIIDNQSRTNPATVVVVISRATPTGTRPTLTIVSPTTLGTAAKVRIIWTNTDDGTGLKSYRLQQSYRGGAFKPVSLNTAKSKSVLRSLTFGKSYRYRLKVTDTAGNVSPWAISPAFVVSRSQESSVGIAYTGSWALASSATYSGGKARWANAAGASATYSFSGESVAWVSSKGRTRGAAQVFIDGILVKTVSLFSSRTTARQVVFSTAWPTTGLHTIQIVVLGTAGHSRIDVDSFVVAR